MWVSRPNGVGSGRGIRAGCWGRVGWMLVAGLLVGCADDGSGPGPSRPARTRAERSGPATGEKLVSRDAAPEQTTAMPGDAPTITDAPAADRSEDGIRLASAETPIAGDPGDRLRPSVDASSAVGSASGEPTSEPDQTTAAASKSELFAGWPEPRAVLVLTGRQYGYVEPCGCAGLENQKGGLTRRHRLIQELGQKGWKVLPIDAGNQVRRYGRQPEIKFQMTVSGLTTMGYQVIGLGPNDLRLPALELAAMIAPDESASRFVCANVTVLDESFTSKWRLLQAGGLRIGVTTVVGAHNRKLIQTADITMQDAAAAIEKIWPEMRQAGCDLYLLVAQASFDESQALARQFPQFALVVTSGGGGEPARQPEPIDGAAGRLIKVGQKGMYAGVLGLYADARQPWRYQRVPLDSRFKDTSEMLQLLAAYQQALANAGWEGLGIRPQPLPGGGKFAGSASCEDCHEKEYAIWKEGRDGHAARHAHALATLQHPPQRADIPRDHDPECLSCHVVGWNAQKHYPYVSGYLSPADTPEMTDVGCENCHGPGKAHVDAENGDVELDEEAMEKLRDGMKLTKTEASEGKCANCHDLDNSPDFDFNEYWKQIKH